MAAEVEEALADADPLPAEDLGPGAGHDLLDRRPWPLERPILLPLRRELEPGERPAVHLAARRLRQRLHEDGLRRHHVVRQEAAQIAAHVRPRRSRRHRVGHQALALGLPHRDDRALAQPRAAGEDGLDLAGLDAEAAHLDLLVGPAQILQRAVREPARQVARAVEPRAGLAKGTRHKALGGQVRAVEVAPRQAVAADAELARRSQGYRPQLAVQHPDAGIGDRPPQRHAPAFRDGLDVVADRERRALGRAVAVEHPVAGLALLQRFPHPARRQRLAAGQQVPHPAKAPRRLPHDLVEKRRGQEARRDVPPPHGLPQRGRRQHHVARKDHRRRAGQQRPPDLEGGGVEGGVREMRRPVPRPQAHVVGVQHQPVDRPVRHGHALRPPRRARGVEHVGQGVAAPLRRNLFPAWICGQGRQRQDACLLWDRPQDDSHRGAAVLQQVAAALGGVRGIERHVEAAGLEHPEHAGDQLRRALQVERHRHLGAAPPPDPPPDPHSAQVPRQAARAPVQLGVGHLPAIPEHGRRLRRPRRGLLEDAVHRHLPGVRRLGAAPIREELAALRLGQQRQVAERQRGIGGGPGGEDE